jgi:hypothetical protein
VFLSVNNQGKASNENQCGKRFWLHPVQHRMAWQMEKMKIFKPHVDLVKTTPFSLYLDVQMSF